MIYLDMAFFDLDAQNAFAMAEDPYSAYSQIEQTQEATQSQSQSQSQESWNSELWGYLKPNNNKDGKLQRIDFYRSQHEYTVGRGSDNNIIFGDLKISNKHCKIVWDQRMTRDSLVIIKDTSSNGTYVSIMSMWFQSTSLKPFLQVNGYKVGRGKTAIVRDGNDISFGQWTTHSNKDEVEFRFTFRLTAAGRPTTGLHAFYDIGNELGRGSFATVMSAVRRDTGEKYAVKVIHLNRFRYSTDPDAALKFHREIEILEAVDHPNICQLVESFKDEATINLVLEYLAGGDLLDHIVSRNGVSEEEARRYTFQLCSALRYLHAKNIAHRDLKPENILLTDDNPPVVKIADFGLAKAADSMTKFMVIPLSLVYSFSHC